MCLPERLLPQLAWMHPGKWGIIRNTCLYHSLSIWWRFALATKRYFLAEKSVRLIPFKEKKGFSETIQEENISIHQKSQFQPWASSDQNWGLQQFDIVCTICVYYVYVYILSVQHPNGLETDSMTNIFRLNSKFANLVFWGLKILMFVYSTEPVSNWKIFPEIDFSCLSN